MQRRFLFGSRWTSNTALPERHFEVIEVIGDAVKLRAVLTKRECTVAIDELETAWTTGWVSV
ncbi:MAG: TIGR02450 family Trp-rich protein [Kofleriaceae bacterium]